MCLCGAGGGARLHSHNIYRMLVMMHQHSDAFMFVSVIGKLRVETDVLGGVVLLLLLPDYYDYQNDYHYHHYYAFQLRC